MTFCIVFFFKQKTAYEMRISDWSSDVCSSDLIAHRGERIDRGGNLRAAVEHVDIALVAKAFGQQHVIGRAALRMRPAKRGARRGRQQVGKIGRASGREGVCQYV